MEMGKGRGKVRMRGNRTEGRGKRGKGERLEEERRYVGEMGIGRGKGKGRRLGRSEAIWEEGERRREMGRRREGHRSPQTVW